ncbi:hypothetical protein ABCR94_02020 [Streptomyces sp. 21So2-11]|uniref:hypothetical protein n=1 Tax=Streptomyces sp. 21So2-11 TaxID=3144408 RepID=UPI00321B6348
MTTDPTSPTERQIPAWISTVGTGWAPLLNQLHRDLLALAADYQLDAFGTKFGGLRIHVGDRFDDDGEFDGDFTDAAAALVDEAEIASEHTCELCGQPGRPRFRGDQHQTWITTACDTCRTRHVQQAAPVGSAATARPDAPHP